MQWAFLVLAIWAVLILLGINRSLDRLNYLLQRMELTRLNRVLWHLVAAVYGHEKWNRISSKIHEEDQIDSSNS